MPILKGAKSKLAKVTKKAAPPPEPEELDDKEAEEEPDENEEEASEEEAEPETRQAKSDGKRTRVKAKKKVADPLVRLVKEPELKYGGPQVQGILKCLEENDNELKLSELAHKLSDYIKTKQKPDRIFAFYRRALENAGVIQVV